MKALRVVLFHLMVVLSLNGLVSLGSFSAWGVLQPDLETLSNGLKIAWFPDERVPLIDVCWVIQAGYRDDPKGKSGTAQLLGEILDHHFDGKNLQGSRVYKVDDDAMSFGFHGLAEDSVSLIEMGMKTLGHPDISKALFLREQKKWTDRWSQFEELQDNHANNILGRTLRVGTFDARRNFLSLENFKKIQQEDVQRFHQRYFLPSNSLLIITGAFSGDTKTILKERILSLSQDWPKGGPVKHDENQFEEIRLKSPSPWVYLLDYPELPQAEVRVGFTVRDALFKDHAPLILANTILGSSPKSRFNSQVRDLLGLTYFVGSTLNLGKGLSTLVVQSTARSETIGKLTQAILEVLRNFKTNPIQPDELALAQRFFIGSFLTRMDSTAAIANRWASMFLLGLGKDYLQSLPSKIEALSPAEVQGVVQRDFDLDHVVIVVSGKAQELRKVLEESGFKSIKQVLGRDPL